jgi:quercetin dioxygenase-like cupin family protein
MIIPKSNVVNIIPVHSLTYDGATLNIFHANKGEGLPAHNHKFAHATMCLAGSCIVRKENKELIMTKITQPVNLIADDWHEIEALEDGTVFANMFAEGKY